MRLLFVIKGLVVKGGGAERVFVDVVNALAERGQAIDVATFDHDGADFFYALSEKVTVHRLSAGEPGRPTPRAALLRLPFRLRSLVRQVRPDAVVAFMHSAYVPVSMALIGTRVPLITSEHIDAQHYATRPLQRLLKDVATARAAAKTVPTRALREEMPPRARERVVVIGNPVDLAAFESGRRRDPLEPPRILSVGRLMHQKDFPTLITAFEQVADEFPTWQLRIVGDGELRAQLEEQIAAGQHGDRIELAGVSSTMPEEYAAASLVAVPSLYESFGLVTAEALASARPVVGFADCVGTADLIGDDQNGVLVVPTDDRPAALAHALRRLMRDPALRARLSAAGPSSLDRFAPSAIVDQWAQLIDAVIARRPVHSLSAAGN